LSLLLLPSACGSTSSKPNPGVCEAPCEIVAEGFSKVPFLSADESGVYVMDGVAADLTLTRIPADGGPPVVLADAGSPLAMLVYEHRVYWIDMGIEADAKTRVLSIDVAGGAVTTHYEGDDAFTRLAVDDTNAFLGIPDKALFRLSLADSVLTPYAGLGRPGMFSVDHGTLFVSDESTCQLKSAPAAGGDPTLLYQGIVTTEYCETDEFTAIAGNLFWAAMSNGSVSGALKTSPEVGGTPRTLDGRFSSFNGPVGDEANLYLSVMPEGHGQSIFKVPVNGGKARLLFQGLAGPQLLGGIAFDGRRVYFVEPVGDVETRVLSLPK
jgi:hypothetical protein